MPVPATADPSVLTTQQILREVQNTQQLHYAHLDGVEALMTEKFRAVEQEFILVERQRIEQKSDTKAAVDAALTAQKEAVKEQTAASGLAIAKSEAGTAKQLEQIGVQFGAAINSQATTIGDLKDRMQRIESLKAGSQQAVAALYASVGVVVSLVIAVSIIVGTR